MTMIVSCHSQFYLVIPLLRLAVLNHKKATGIPSVTGSRYLVIRSMGGCVSIMHVAHSFHDTSMYTLVLCNGNLWIYLRHHTLLSCYRYYIIQIMPLTWIRYLTQTLRVMQETIIFICNFSVQNHERRNQQ